MEKEEEGGGEKRSKPVQLCACGKRIRSPRSLGAARAATYKKKRRYEERDDPLPDDALAVGEDDDGDDEVVIIEPPELALNGESVSRKQDTRRLLVEMIQARFRSRSTASVGREESQRWSSRVYEFLSVKATQETLELLARECGAIAEQLRQQMHEGRALDLLRYKRSSASSLIEILKLLPRLNELARYPFPGARDEPSAPDTCDSFDQARMSSLSVSARLQATMDLVDRVTSLCASLMGRIEQHERERNANEEHETLVYQGLQRLLCHLVDGH